MILYLGFKAKKNEQEVSLRILLGMALQKPEFTQAIE